MNTAGSPESAKPKLAILVNIVAPYRVPVYEALAESFDVLLLYSGSESNRTTWEGTLVGLQGCKAKRSWGFTLSRRIRKGSSSFDNRYLHINPGFLFDLIRFRPAAVISIEMGFRSLTALLYGAVARRPVWIWWGGTRHTEKKVGPFKRVLRRVFVRVVKRWISYGQTSTEYLLSIGVKRDRVLQIQNCVDERRFAEPVEPSLDVKPKPVLLVVGQLVGRKGVEELIRAASAVHEEGSEFSLLFVGEGPSKQAYVDLADELGLPNVHFVGARGPQEMPAIYRSADCLVFPSLEDVWGLVVNEALWAGLPVLSSILAGCSEELVAQDCWFDPLDPEDLRRALRRAVAGAVHAPCPPLLWPHRRVSGAIADDVRERISRA